MVNFGPLAAEIDPVVWGTPANFNGFRVLAALLYLAGWPSRWALAHILVSYLYHSDKLSVSSHTLKMTDCIFNIFCSKQTEITELIIAITVYLSL